MKNVIFDLDGTLALCDHRRHHVESAPKNWDAFFSECDKDAFFSECDKDAFFSECDKDAVNEPVARLFRFYRDSPEHRVWILSGRMGTTETRGKTCKWLEDNDLTPDVWISHDYQVLNFHMRDEDDYRHDTEVKYEMIQRLGLTPENTECVFDDRNCMVKAWRLWGFLCMQVAEGDF